MIKLYKYFWGLITGCSWWTPLLLHVALIECSVLDALPAPSQALSALQIPRHLLLSHPPREKRHLQIRWPQTCFINKTCSSIALRLAYCSSEMNGTSYFRVIYWYYNDILNGWIIKEESTWQLSSVFVLIIMYAIEDTFYQYMQLSNY